MFSLEQMIKRLDPKGIRHKSHGLKYSFAVIYTPDLSPRRGFLYICPDGVVPDALKEAADSGCLLMGETTPETDADFLACEWALWEAQTSPETLLALVVNAAADLDAPSHIRSLLDENIIGQKNLPEVIREACKIIGNPILLCDSAYKIIAQESLGRRVESALWQRVKKSGAFIAEEITVFRNQEAFDTLSSVSAPILCTTGPWEDMSCLSMNILSSQGGIHGRLAVYEAFRPFNSDDCENIGVLADVISTMMETRKETDNGQGMRVKLLEDLLLDSEMSDSNLNDRIASCRWRRFRLYQVAYVDLSENNSALRQIDYFTRAFSADSDELTVFAQEKSILILFSSDSYQDLKKNIDLLQKKLSRHQLSCGLSGCFTSLKSLQAEVCCAREAGYYGERILQDNEVYRYSQTIIFSLLNKLDPSELRTLYSLSSYYQLEQYDQRKEGNYCDTLNCYLRNCMNSAQTTNELFIHKNSLLYRLGRIKELVGVDVNNYTDSFDYWFGRHIMLYLRWKEDLKA